MTRAIIYLLVLLFVAIVAGIEEGQDAMQGGMQDAAAAGVTPIPTIPPTARPCLNPVPNATVPAGFCAQFWATGLNAPRGMLALTNGDLIVVEKGLGQLSLFYKSAGVYRKVVLTTGLNLNHAVVLNGTFLYASSATTVYRWYFPLGTRSSIGLPTTIVKDIPGSGTHKTRSLLITGAYLYVQIGSGSNVDMDTTTSGVKVFTNLTAESLPRTWGEGNWYAQGLRNTIALRYDRYGFMWGLDNGVENLFRSDLGGDLQVGNPADELNLVTYRGFFGYPYCWTQYNTTSKLPSPRGTQYSTFPFVTDGTHSDAWCRNRSNVSPPMFTVRPHSAPTDLMFYYGLTFPAEYNGDVFIAQHGSSLPGPQPVTHIGYRVVKVDLKGLPYTFGAETPFFSYSGPGEYGPGWHRPVGLALLRDSGRDVMLISSEETGVIISVSYRM